VIVAGRSYKDCVGEYQRRPEDDVETIFVKDGKLRGEAGVEEGEWLPAGGDTFFFKDDLGASTFSRDAQGRVTGYTYYRVDGQEIHVKKTK
jgi:hypothetical protein